MLMAKAERVDEVMPLETLVKALSNASNADLAALSYADFDMPDRRHNIGGINVRTRTRHRSAAAQRYPGGHRAG